MSRTLKKMRHTGRARIVAPIAKQTEMNKKVLNLFGSSTFTKKIKIKIITNYKKGVVGSNLF